mgnify:CR=1 FL=1
MRLSLLKTTLHLAVGLLLVFSLPCQAEPSESASPADTDKPDKILVGSVEDDRYIARDKSFSFKLPIKGSPRALKEAITDTLSPGTHAILIKSISESSNYRFEISRVRPGGKKNNNFTQATAKTFDWYRRLIQRTWRVPITEIVTEEFNWNGRRSVHAIFKQFANEKSGPRYHIFYLTDFGDNVILLWTNISLPEEDLEEEDKIIAASSGPALKSKQSFLSFRFD